MCSVCPFVRASHIHTLPLDKEKQAIEDLKSENKPALLRAIKAEVTKVSAVLTEIEALQKRHDTLRSMPSNWASELARRKELRDLWRDS